MCVRADEIPSLEGMKTEVHEARETGFFAAATLRSALPASTFTITVSGPVRKTAEEAEGETNDCRLALLDALSRLQRRMT